MFYPPQLLYLLKFVSKLQYWKSAFSTSVQLYATVNPVKKDWLYSIRNKIRCSLSTDNIHDMLKKHAM